MPRQHQYFTLQTVQTNRISVAVGIWNIKKLENESILVICQEENKKDFDMFS